MKTRISALILVMFFSILGTAGATSYYENFYGAWNDWNKATLYAGDKVTLNFNLSQLNSGSPLPTTDEKNFVSGSLIDSARLDFTFSSGDSAYEHVQVKAGLYDGNKVLADKTYDLDSYWVRGQGYVDSYAQLSIDLAGLLGKLSDGAFTALVIAVNDCGNDFYLDQASLTVTTKPVPEPASMLLLGTGLIGIGCLTRRRLVNA